MNNVFKFPSPKIKSEEEPIYVNMIEDIADDTVQDFLINIVNNVENINIDLLMNDDYETQKILAFLRETMLATVDKLQGKEHGIQSIAYDVIYFTEDTKEKIIELEDI